MEESQEIAVYRPDGGSLRVSLATPEEISRMSDLRAIEKIDELREAARIAAGMGLDVESRTLYANACDIVEHNLIVPETIAEYADLLESQGLAEPAADYRSWHEEFMEKLAEYDLPKPAYEECLRAEVAHAHQSERPQPRGNEPKGTRERLGEVAAQARSAAQCLGAQPARELPTPTWGRGQQ